LKTIQRSQRQVIRVRTKLMAAAMWAGLVISVLGLAGSAWQLAWVAGQFGASRPEYSPDHLQLLLGQTITWTAAFAMSAGLCAWGIFRRRT